MGLPGSVSQLGWGLVTGGCLGLKDAFVHPRRDECDRWHGESLAEGTDTPSPMRLSAAPRVKSPQR